MSSDRSCLHLGVNGCLGSSLRDEVWWRGWARVSGCMEALSQTTPVQISLL